MPPISPMKCLKLKKQLAVLAIIVFAFSFIDGRRVCVDDDTFAIINAGRSYGSRINALRPVHSFSVFFEPRLLGQVSHALRGTTAELLDSPAAVPDGAIEFDERLYEHDLIVSPVLRQIWSAVNAGADDEGWLEG